MHPLASALPEFRRQASLGMRMAVALVLFAAGLGVRLFLVPAAGLSYAPFYLPVLAAFVLTGSLPGTLCLVLALLAGGLPLALPVGSAALALPAAPLAGSAWAQAALFGAVGVAVGCLTHLLHAQSEGARVLAQDCRSALAEQAERLRKERQRFAEAQAAGQREIEVLYEQAPCGYHALAADGTILRMNRTALQWLGMAREEAIGRPIADFFTDEGRAQFAAHFPQFLRQGTVRDLEFELCARDGTRRFVQVSARAIRGEDGRVSASWSLMQDITELRRARLALLEQQQRLRAFSQVPLPIALLRRRDCVVLEANHDFLDLVGYPECELVGHSTVDLGIWTRPDQLQSLLRQIGIVGSLRDFPMDFRRRSGTPGSARCSCTQVWLEGEECLLTSMSELPRGSAGTGSLRAQEASSSGTPPSLPDACESVLNSSPNEDLETAISGDAQYLTKRVDDPIEWADTGSMFISGEKPIGQLP